MLSEFSAVPDSVLVHDPVAVGAFAEFERTGSPNSIVAELLFRERPETHRYARQHHAFVEQIRRHGTRVIYLSEIASGNGFLERAEGNPNQVFTRDSLITLPWSPEGYIAARMKPELRRSECQSLEVAARALGLRPLIELPEDFFLEGGDVIPFSREGRRTLLVGHGPRSSREALFYLQQMLIPAHADEIIGIELSPCRMNLDGGLLPVCEDVLVTHAGSIGKSVLLDAHGSQALDVLAMFRDLGYRLVEATQDESIYQQACNCLCLGDRKVIFYDLCERVRRLLEEHDVTVIAIEGSELVKGRGGPRCMTRPLYRGAT